MGRHELTSRLDIIERRLSPAGDWQVWLPLDDERDDLVHNAASGETLTSSAAARLSGRHIVVTYVDGEDWRTRRPAACPYVAPPR